MDRAGSVGVAGPAGGVATDRPPLQRGRSLTDVLRGLVISNQSQPSSATVGGIKSIPEEMGGGTAGTDQSLGRLVQSQGLTAASGPCDPSKSSTLPSNTSDSAQERGSWSFFWRSSAQKVIEMNRESIPAEETGGEQKSKILGAYMAGGGEGGGKPITNLVGAVTAMQQMEAAKAGTGGSSGLGTAGSSGMGTASPAGGRKGLLNLPDRMNVGKKDMNVFSPSSF